MMIITFHRRFWKTYAAKPVRVRQRCDERIALFRDQPFAPILNNHPLMGKWLGYRSINIGGDVRAVFKPLSDDTVIFVRLGTHSELYG